MTTLRCSCCFEYKLPAWFGTRKTKRGYSYWCKSCTRKASLRHFYRKKLDKLYSRILDLEQRLLDIDLQIGPGARSYRKLKSPDQP